MSIWQQGRKGFGGASPVPPSSSPEGKQGVSQGLSTSIKICGNSRWNLLHLFDSSSLTGKELGLRTLRPFFTGWLFSGTDTNQCFWWLSPIYKEKWTEPYELQQNPELWGVCKMGVSQHCSCVSWTKNHSWSVSQKRRRLCPGSLWRVTEVWSREPGSWADLPLYRVDGPFKPGVLSQARTKENGCASAVALGAGESDLSMMLW